MKLSIIIPLYNEKSTVVELINGVKSAALPEGLDREIVIVDDGSTDGGIGENEKEIFPDILFLKHDKNKGKGAAIRSGLKFSKGEIIVIQDADMEYLPSDIPDLIAPIISGKADAVYGSRFKGDVDGMSLSHYIGNRIISLSTRILFGVSVTDVLTGHKAFRRVGKF